MAAGAVSFRGKKRALYKLYAFELVWWSLRAALRVICPSLVLPFLLRCSQGTGWIGANHFLVQNAGLILMAATHVAIITPKALRLGLISAAGRGHRPSRTPAMLDPTTSPRYRLSPTTQQRGFVPFLSPGTWPRELCPAPSVPRGTLASRDAQGHLQHSWGWWCCLVVTSPWMSQRRAPPCPAEHTGSVSASQSLHGALLGLVFPSAAPGSCSSSVPPRFQAPRSLLQWQ